MLKSLILSILFRRWPRLAPVGGSRTLQPGYSILLPSPMDMPFLLRYALEGLRALDTTHCRQILVIPDGWGTDNAAALRHVVKTSPDPRVQLVHLTAFDYRIIHAMRPPGSAATHWMMVINGTKNAVCEHAFLHDADAFFLEKSGLERQYLECRDRQMHTLGVTPRWDPFFTDVHYQIPGTWELMFSVDWARQKSPYHLKGRKLKTDRGTTEFDSMLARQYLEYNTGKIGVMQTPPKFVHFNGTIFSYRMFRDARGRPVTDELFRILLLSLLETLITDSSAPIVPTVAQLVRGLTDNTQSVRYPSPAQKNNYLQFRSEINQLAESPVFQGPRAAHMQALLQPFDAHYNWHPEARAQTLTPQLRIHGIA